MASCSWLSAKRQESNFDFASASSFNGPGWNDISGDLFVRKERLQQKKVDSQLLFCEKLWGSAWKGFFFCVKFHTQKSQNQDLVVEPLNPLHVKIWSNRIISPVIRVKIKDTLKPPPTRWAPTTYQLFPAVKKPLKGRFRIPGIPHF